MEIIGTLSKFDFNHWQYHIPIEDNVVNELMKSSNRRLLVWIENNGPFHMALFKAKVCWYILINKEIRGKYNLELGQKVNLKLEADTSEYGHEVPEEFSVLLDQDDEASSYFNLLTKGKQRSLIYLVTKVKNPESRMKKSLAIMHHLRLSKGKLDFKQLNELIKFYNNQ